jgi:uncharacterized delta-60 repeat protein
MNHIYRTVWNEITRSFVAAAESVKSHGKRVSSKSCTASAEHVVGAAPSRRGLVTSRLNLMRLEPRLVFDGAAVDTVVAVDAYAQEQKAPAAEASVEAETAAAAQSVTTTDARQVAAAFEGTAPYTALLLTAGDAAQRSSRTEIAFVEDSVADWQSLASSVPAGVEVVKLDSRGDGLKQIADYLASRSDVDAIHILSHGSDGQVNLGALTLNSSNLDVQANTLAQIGQALTADGDILLYGCEVSQTGNGQAFINDIARLTQADVAASSDLTGNAANGGDWVLEVATGNVVGDLNVGIPASHKLSVSAWNGLLTTAPVQGTTTFDGLSWPTTANGTGPFVATNFGSTGWDISFNGGTLDPNQTIGIYPTNSGNPSTLQIRAYSNGGGGTGETLTSGYFKSNDGSEFKLTSLKIGIVDKLTGNSDPAQVRFTGYKNGQAASGAELLATVTSTLQTFSFNSNFSDIDEVKMLVVSNNISALEIDDILIAAPVPPPADGTYTFANSSSNGNGTYTTNDGFFLISAVNGEYSTPTDDLVVADSDGVYVNSGGGAYTGAPNPGPASPTSYLEVTPAVSGRFIMDAAVIGEISNISDPSDPAYGNDSDYTNIYLVGYANGAEVARTVTHSSVGTLDPTYAFPANYFSQFSGKYIDTVRLYFDTPTGDIADRITLISMDISGASTTPAPVYPTLTTLSTLTGGTEDTAKTITFSDLTAAGNEGDTDGNVDAFVVKAVTTGTLTIGGSAWNVSTNNTIDATHSASWTPNPDAQGNALNAFTVVAKDNSGAESATPVQVKMDVAGANDAPTFSVGNGMLSIATPGDYDAPTDAQLQPTSGKLIVAYQSVFGLHPEWYITRLNLDGTVDSSFGDTNSGTPGKTPVYNAYAIDIGANGKITYAYYILDGSITPIDQLAVGRLNADGSLDTSFGGGASTYTLPLASATTGFRPYEIDVKTLADGSVLVARTTMVSSKNVIEVVKLTSAGALDTTFGASGKLHVPNGGSHQFVGAMTVNADGSILIGGHQADTDFMVVKVTAAGVVDTNFGASGQAIVSMNSDAYPENLERVTSIGVQSNGKIVVAGYSGFNDQTMALARLNTDGTLDASFGSSGKMLIDASNISSGVTAKEWINSITILHDDSIVVSGKIDYYSANSLNTPDQFAILKLTSNGVLDTTFGTNSTGIVAGRVVTFPNNELYPTNNAMAAVELSDGGVMVVTRTPSLEDLNNTGYTNIGLVRLQSNGAYDQYFGVTSTLGTTVAYTENGAAVALDTSVGVFDPELAATGNYDGAVVTLQRSGTASSDDVFSAKTGSNLTLASGNVVLSGTTIGTFTNTGGVLTFTFNTSATQARINEALSSLAYENASNTPPASVTIDWSMKESSAGNALTGSGSTTVTITPAPDSTDNTVYFPGGAEYTFSLSDFGIYSPSSGSDGSSPTYIKIVSVPVSGGLTLNGSTVNAGDELQASDIPNLKYLGVADSFTFQVGDNTNGVPPFSPTVYSGENYTLTLAPNEAPTLDATKSPAFNAALGATAPVNGVTTGSVLVSDLINSDSAGLNNFADTNGDAAGVAITGVNGGTLWYSIDAGATWTALTGTVSDSSALVLYANADTRVYYQPASNATAGTISDALTVRAWDHTGNAANGATGVAATSSVATVLDSATDGNDPTLREMIISGDYAFARDTENSSLMVFNVADPTNITWVRTVPLGDTVRDIKTDGTHVYLANDNTGGVKIFAISDLIGSLPTVTPVGSYLDSANNRIYSVEVDGTTAYASVRDVGVVKLNIANPALPTLTATNAYLSDGTTYSNNYINDLTKIGNYLYGYDYFSLLTFDTTNPTAPPTKVDMPNSGNELIESDGMIWVRFSRGAHGYSVDADTGALTRSILIDVPSASVNDISFNGTTAYVATSAGALRFDLSATPDSTTNGVATFSTPTGIYVDADNGTNSVLATANGVFVGHTGDLASLDFDTVQVGNAFSTATDTVAVTVAQSDSTAPTLASSTPADNATAVAKDSDIVLTFSENVTAVTGKNVVIYKTSDDSVVTTIDAADAQVSITGGVVRVNPTADLGYGTAYYVKVDAGAFKDAANNTYAGITSTTALSFITEAAPSDITSPIFANASVTGNALTLTYGEALSGTLPAASAFTVTMNGVANPVTAVAIDSNDPTKLNLTLTKAVAFGKTLTVGYTNPGVNNAVATNAAIQDAAGNDAANFNNVTVSSSSAATTSFTMNSVVQPSRAVTLSVPTGLSINDVTNTAAPSTLPKTVKLPLGQFGFEISGVAVGGTASLSMELDANLKSLGYYKQNLVTGKWDNIATSSAVNTATGKATVNFSLVDGGAYDADRIANGVIVDPGGAGENSLLPYVLENTVDVGTVVLVNTNQVNGTISYELTGGADLTKFRLDANTGALVFISAPDFETPTDAGEGTGNNTYSVQVTIRGSNGGREVQNLVVTVLNVLEAGETGGVSTVAMVTETTPTVTAAVQETPYVPPPVPTAPPPVVVVQRPVPVVPVSDAPPVTPPAALSQPVESPPPAMSIGGPVFTPPTRPDAPAQSSIGSPPPPAPAPTSLPVLTAAESGAFQVAVAPRAPGGAEALVVNRPVGDIAVAEGARVSVTIPSQSFAHTSASAAVTLSAQRADGAPLPGWMSFNPQTGTFEGTPPPGFKGEVVVRVIARDKDGRQAVQVFKIAVGVGQGDVARDPAQERPDSPGQAPRPQAPGQRGAVLDTLGKPSLAKQFDRHGLAARHAGTNDLLLAARKVAQTQALSGRV